MSKELKQDKYEGLGNGPWNEGYFPTAKQECIWNIPEDKRRCEFCTANCVNAHTVSTSTELEQAAEEYAQSLSKGAMAGKEYCKQDFKAGAEWKEEQLLDWAKQFTEPKIFVSTLIEKLEGRL